MRRGHGSTKVPGVKLRPAAPTKSSKLSESSKQTSWEELSKPDEVDSTEILRSCKKPFVGVVVCASGLSDKVNVFQQAVQLGAQTSSDLTDRVTHLICEAPGSAKYKYCVEHGIPILQPSWITDVYGKWINGESIDVLKSASIHRFPAFKTVRLCLTGINDIQRRKEIRRQLEKNGGTFVEALDKDAELTHLLCGPDRGENPEQKAMTSKMQFVIKANKTRKEKAYLVWEDWFWDCLEFKGILNEIEYLATGPRPSRRIRREPSPLLVPIASTADQNLRRQLSTVSIPQLDNNADIEETANIKRVPEAAAMLCENLLRRRGFEMKNGKLTRSPSRTQASSFLDGESSRLSPSPMPVGSRVEVPINLESVSRTRSSLTAAFKRTKSFAAKTAEPESSKSVFERVRSTPAAVFKQAGTPLASAHSEATQIPEGERILFVGLKFRALGEASGPKLTEALELRGGTVINDPDGEVDYIIVRLVGGNLFYKDEPKKSVREKYRTECWIEQCIYEERICASDEHPAFIPIRVSTPIPGADKLVLHTSGLTPSEKTPSVRLIKAIGANVSDQLSRKNTHLICPCGSGPKFTKAQEWNIPILNLQWLFATAKSGTIQNINEYLVTTGSLAPVSAPASAPENDKMMTDITNSEFVQGSSRAKGFRKGSDKSQSPTSSSVAAAVASHAEIQLDFSNARTVNALLAESGQSEHPPTSSSPAFSSRSVDDNGPTTPSPVRRHATVGAEISTFKSRAPAVSPFTSPAKAKRSVTAIIADSERVPSSATPSPLRMPSKGTTHPNEQGEAAGKTRATSPSPATATTSTLSGESASVLKEAIASLLGKRSSSDDAAAGVTDAESQKDAPGHTTQRGLSRANTRATKRSKPPPRTRSSRQADSDSFSGAVSGRPGPFSRTTSLEVLPLPIGRTGSGSHATYSFDFSVPPPSGDGISESATELQLQGKDAMEAEEESMRVTYEDPSQRAEERRLLNLISGSRDAMDADNKEESVVKHEISSTEPDIQEEKKPQPRPRRRGKNLVRRVTNVTERL